MKSSDIRRRFLEYFAGKGHAVVPSAGLIPGDDPTLLFTNAGMVPFKGVFLGTETREYKTAASCQKCVRAGGKHNDLENVGQTARHHTFFEMLGNFSFGDYFKEGAIKYAWEFLTKEMKLPAEKLWITVFETDDEAAGIWEKKAGVPLSRIVRMGEKDNFWSMGETGPCGPCSEILIDQGADVGCGHAECAVGCDCDRFLEIWNLVFMQYNRGADGALTSLSKQCIDTGMGLERLSAVMQGKKTNYDSDLFTPIIKRIESLTGIKYGTDHDHDISIRAVADHARAITFLMTDGVLPSNEGRGYVLRRIIRRAARHGRYLGIKEPFLHLVNEKVIEIMGDVYPEIREASGLISRATKGEEERFFETLERGLALLDDEIRLLKEKKETVVPGDITFRLYDTFGFPSDLTADIVRKYGLTVDEAGFNTLMDEQKTKARSAWKGAAAGTGAEIYKSLSNAGVKTQFVGYHMEAVTSRIHCIIRDGVSVAEARAGDTVEIVTEETPFYAESGGQVGDTGVMLGAGFAIEVLDTRRPVGDLIVHYCKIKEGSVSAEVEAELIPDLEKRKATARNHTATHILHAVLRKTIGTHLRQAGSLVAPRGLRFDFNHFEALSPEELKSIEAEANRVVLENLAVTTDVLPYSEAVDKGALAFFGEKYGETVRMVRVDGVSAELCGGTHVKRSGDIGVIKITGEGSVASGVRRIEAVTGAVALEALNQSEETLKDTAQLLKVPKTDVPEKIKKLIEANRELEREVATLKGRDKAGEATTLLDVVRTINGVKVVAARVATADPKELREMADTLRVKLGSGIVVLAAEADSKVVLLAAVTRDLTKRFSAGDIIKKLAPVVGGRGGGKADLAQAGGTEAKKIDEALKLFYKTVEETA